MATTRQTLTLLSALTGAVAVGQAPEFAQQYMQRLGGALDELAVVVADFDADAARNGLSRLEALETHQNSATPLFRDRGVSMLRTIDRYEALLDQAARFERLPPVARPLVLATGPDNRLMTGAWRAFEPALPLTPHGLAWTAFGFIAGVALAWLVALPFRRRRGPVEEMARANHHPRAC